jgi:hypothetical protein
MANATGGMRPSSPQYGAKKKATPSPKPKATKKAAPSPKPKPKPTKNPLTASEKAFLKNQREKAKALKRTGIYPNTAN